jgi:TPR repeat protein
MYHGGRGVPQDFAVAVKWWRKAAEVKRMAREWMKNYPQ